MKVRENVSLKDYSTMRLGGVAHYLAEAKNQQDIVGLVEWANNKEVPTLVVGGGSNIVWRDEGYDGLIVVNKIKGRQILSESEAGATIRVGAGENWDEVVAWTVGKNLSGLEFLSLIPGSAGAGPVQNIGAYGAELSTVLQEVAVYDKKTNSFGSLANKDCGFAYRSSRFKTSDKGRYVITSLVIELKKNKPEPPFYEVLQEYLDEHNITDYSPASIRQAVISIRSAKLPDPAVIANNGSFFTNPIVSQNKFEQLKAMYPDVRAWQTDDGHVKIAAGWLVEQAGFRGYHDHETGMATSKLQALVLINESAKSTADLLTFKQKIVDKVEQMFSITLEQEPELLP